MERPARIQKKLDEMISRKSPSFDGDEERVKTQSPQSLIEKKADQLTSFYDIYPELNTPSGQADLGSAAKANELRNAAASEGIYMPPDVIDRIGRKRRQIRKPKRQTGAS